MMMTNVLGRLKKGTQNLKLIADTVQYTIQ